ncbi:MAG TPA: hypothetical protein DER64_06300 [Planctomycetaceae bacterium]|nr:hypothetical protein [Planctomycetaceae bacterium]
MLAFDPHASSQRTVLFDGPGGQGQVGTESPAVAIDQFDAAGPVVGQPFVVGEPAITVAVQ